MVDRLQRIVDGREGRGGDGEAGRRGEAQLVHGEVRDEPAEVLRRRHGEVGVERGFGNGGRFGADGKHAAAGGAGGGESRGRGGGEIGGGIDDDEVGLEVGGRGTAGHDLDSEAAGPRGGGGAQFRRGVELSADGEKHEARGCGKRGGSEGNGEEEQTREKVHGVAGDSGT